MAAAVGGHAALGESADDRIAAGARADLVTISLGSHRLADASDDCLLEAAVYAAGASDVSHVVAGGRLVVADVCAFSLVTSVALCAPPSRRCSNDGW
ncbi:MAG TPA: hypothetical protein VMV17_00870 [Streptosporangiaceae bacterium]|nr:hypothetical protein [Streptosporangiaceae bacterium]